MKHTLNPTLIFGSDDFYEKLKIEIPGAASDDDVNRKVYDAVKNDVYGFIQGQSDLVNDHVAILNDVALAVLKGLPEFLKNPDFFSMSSEECEKAEKKDKDFTPPTIRRQSWLKTITERRISDYRKKRKKIEENEVYYTAVEDSGTGSNTGETTNDIDYRKNPGVLQKADENSAENKYFKRILHPKLEKKFRELYKLHIDPERLIGYTYSYIIIPLLVKNKKKDKWSGKPSETIELLQSMTVGEAFIQMKSDLSRIIEKDFPESMFTELEREVNRTVDGKRVSERIFSLSASEISCVTHYINKKWLKNTSTYNKRKEDSKAESEEQETGVSEDSRSDDSDDKGKRR